jgi:hypothetical protein
MSTQFDFENEMNKKIKKNQKDQNDQQTNTAQNVQTSPTSSWKMLLPSLPSLPSFRISSIIPLHYYEFLLEKFYKTRKWIKRSLKQFIEQSESKIFGFCVNTKQYFIDVSHEAINLYVYPVIERIKEEYNYVIYDQIGSFYQNNIEPIYTDNIKPTFDEIFSSQQFIEFSNIVRKYFDIFKSKIGPFFDRLKHLAVGLYKDSIGYYNTNISHTSVGLMMKQLGNVINENYHKIRKFIKINVPIGDEMLTLLFDFLHKSFSQFATFLNDFFDFFQDEFANLPDLIYIDEENDVDYDDLPDLIYIAE